MSPEQLRILKELDVDAALRKVAGRGFIPETREIAIAGLHKARLTMSHLFTQEEIEISKIWLKENGYEHRRWD